MTVCIGMYMNVFEWKKELLKIATHWFALKCFWNCNVNTIHIATHSWLVLCYRCCCCMCMCCHCCVLLLIVFLFTVTLSVRHGTCSRLYSASSCFRLDRKLSNRNIFFLPQHFQTDSSFRLVRMHWPNKCNALAK